MTFEPELPTHSLLTLHGWEWITNCGQDDADEVLESFRSSNEDAQYRTGEPYSPHASTVNLIAMGMVGVYFRQEGGRPVNLTFDDPTLPSFSPSIEPETVQPDYSESHTCGMDSPVEATYSRLKKC